MTLQKKIFIIDDEASVLQMLTTVLIPKNYLVQTASAAVDAWDSVMNFKPDLLILDIMMPGMTGIEFCKKVREQPELAHTRIIMLSAKDSQSDRLKGLQYGANDYVTKPFHVNGLVNKIEHLLNK